MDKPRIDFLRQKYQLDAGRRVPFFFFGKILLAVVTVAAVGLVALSYGVNGSGDSGSFPKLALFDTIRHLISSNDRGLNGEGDDRVNFLLLGVGGPGHDGPELSDTILFASLKPSTKSLGMISIPRDLTVPVPGHGMSKINSANAYGEQADPGSGPTLASQVVGDVLGQPIQYYVRIDFSGFEKMIDELGGVDIYVDRSFTDDSYPILGKEDADCGTGTAAASATATDGTPAPAPDYSCRYEVLSFQQGWTHMDGTTALKYVRSRHGTNGEASDFARSARQQKVLLAVREKVLSTGTLLNPGKIGSLVDTLRSSIATNLQLWEMVRLATMLKDVDQTKIATHVLDASPDSPLYATSLNGAYVLLPKNDDWRPIQAMAADVFAVAPPSNVAAATTPKKPEFVKVEVQNGTAVSGLAFRTSQLLEKKGFDVTKVGNAKDRSYAHTVVYDLTGGAKPDQLKALRDYLEADVTQSATGWLMSDNVVPEQIDITPQDESALATDKTIDFLVILGESSANVASN
jgi:polyisoprenyl-teichoic acid--peptidoglycan teichoic acid transferase